VLAVYQGLVGKKKYPVSSLYIIGFSKTRIFSATVVVFLILGKGNIIVFGFLAIGIRSYFVISTIYPKSKLNLFFVFPSTFG
jgi:hypothetical protein